MPESGTLSRNSIQKLPALLVNQIAAGEVVERPASVVKEVVENAIDAGARSIRLELEQGGIELIRVTDDGAGIPSAELPLAVAPHATSKIRAADDLDRIGTMGFRGEALASIASVSRLSIRSRAAGADGADGGGGGGASVIEVEGDRVSPVKPAPGPVGTCVTVRNLFFNTPARRKFLRTPATEQGHCLDAFETLATAHPAVAFTAVCDGRVAMDLPPEQSPRDRAVAVLGRELADQLLEVHADRFDDARGMALWGMIGLPSVARATAKAQRVFLNGRPIRDKTVQHAVREAYRGLIEPGRYPTAVVMIEMDPGAVDVNVHPAKTEVRFRDQSLVHGVVLRAIRDALRAADLTPAVGGGGAPPIGPGSGYERPWAPVGEAREPAPTISPEAFVEYFKRSAPGAASETAGARTGLDAGGTVEPKDAPAATNGVVRPEPGASAEPPLLDARPAERVLQVHNSYVVTQDEQGLLIVDQHALHERVMFEALLARVGQSPLESQSLLVPAVVPASPVQIDRLEELGPLLARIGIAAAPLGPTSLGVQAFPTFLFDRGVDPVEFLTEVLERAEADGFTPGSEEALHEVLDMMACKAAIKAGDRMSDGELKELLRFREAVERSSNCPHGRPTSIRLTIRELEKRFGRT